MKKVLTVCCLIAVLLCGIVFSGCEDKETVEGYFKLNYSLYVDNGILISETAAETGVETYIKISDKIIEEYIFEKSDLEVKVLISYKKHVYTNYFPDFEIKTIDGVKTYIDYSFLTGSLAQNPNKILRKEYHKVNILPTFYQTLLVAYFGDYVLSGEFVNNVPVSLNSDFQITINLNGKLTMTTYFVNGSEPIDKIFCFDSRDGEYYKFKHNQETILIKTSAGKLLIYDNSQDLTCYRIFSLA